MDGTQYTTCDGQKAVWDSGEIEEPDCKAEYDSDCSAKKYDHDSHLYDCNDGYYWIYSTACGGSINVLCNSNGEWVYETPPELNCDNCKENYDKACQENYDANGSCSKDKVLYECENDYYWIDSSDITCQSQSSEDKYNALCHSGEWVPVMPEGLSGCESC